MSVRLNLSMMRVCVMITFALGKNVRHRFRHRIVELAMRECVTLCTRVRTRGVDGTNTPTLIHRFS